MMTQPLLVPNMDSLQRKLAAPPPLLGRLYARFQDRLLWDSEFRRQNIYLAALLGDANAIAEAKGLLFPLALHSLILTHDRAHHRCREEASVGRDAHVWCVAPRALRVAAYFTWLDAHGAWTAAERRVIGTGILDFCYHHVVPVLQARTPAGHNQQLSMTLSCAIVGHAFAGVDGLADRARALRDWALPKLRQTLGLMPVSGYSGEGSTYQSDVVSALVMWSGVFLEQLGETDVWHRRWAPNGACLANSLEMEAALGGCGGLLPPWDHYGWASLHNLAARTLWARLAGNPALLPVAETTWDELDFIAWRSDDRLWTLIYWPETEQEPVAASQRNIAHRPSTIDHEPSALTGWSLPAVGGAIEHLSRRLRVMCVWDRCSGSLQGVSRGQVNPNHLIIDLGGEPVTADGWEDGKVRLVSDAAVARTLAALTPVEQELLAQQYGSVETWVKYTQHGFLGMACSIIVDGWESYFPRHDREGRLLSERREADRHTFTGESAAYYQPSFDVTRMRRTVSMNGAGITWIVDDVRAATMHDFTWRIWLRRNARRTGPQRVQVDLSGGKAMTLAWAGEAAAALLTVPTFPQGRGEPGPWTDEGSVRCDRMDTGQRVRFVTCLVPEAAGDLTVRTVGPGCWEADWTGGSDRFELPAEAESLPDPAPVSGEQIAEMRTQCDLDEAPFALRGEPDEVLLAELDAAHVEDWARTGTAMQTLTAHGIAAAMPRIAALLLDAKQNYTVHSVAAWCLGHARYAPALEALRRMSHIPEVNTALRARWAAERIGGTGQDPSLLPLVGEGELRAVEPPPLSADVERDITKVLTAARAELGG